MVFLHDRQWIGSYFGSYILFFCIFIPFWIQLHPMTSLKISCNPLLEGGKVNHLIWRIIPIFFFADFFPKYFRIQNGINYVFTINCEIKTEQKISREFFLPRSFSTFLIILHHSQAREVLKRLGKENSLKIFCSPLLSL